MKTPEGGSAHNTSCSFVLIDTKGMSGWKVQRHVLDCHAAIRRLRGIIEMMIDGLEDFDDKIDAKLKEPL